MKNKRTFDNKNSGKCFTFSFIQIASFSFLAMLSSFRCSAQQNEGIVHYRVSCYAYKMRYAMEFYNKANAEYEKTIYNFSEKTTLFTDLCFNPEMTKYADKREDITLDHPIETFTSLNLLKHTITRVTPIYEKRYVIIDSLHAPEWTILNDIKEIAGHICSSATTYDPVRRQKVRAWFALDLPLNIGPDRWYGLPGLILEVNINDGALVIETERIEFCKLTTQLDIPKKIKGNVVTQKKYNDIFNKFYTKCAQLGIFYFYRAPY